MGDEELPADKIGLFHWIKLFITSASTLKWMALAVVSILGYGTATNPVIQDQVTSLLSDSVEEPLPTTGPVVPTAAGPDHSAFHAQVRQSLASMQTSILANESLLDQTVEKLDLDSESNDAKLDAKVQQNAAEIQKLKELVQ